MGRRKGKSIPQAEQVALIVHTAQQAVQAKGRAGLSLRAVAAMCALSVGQVHHVAGGLDGLALLLNTQTLQRLEDHLCRALRDSPRGPTARLLALAGAYLDFCKQEAPAWDLVLHPPYLPARALADSAYQAQVARLPQLVADELAVLVPSRNPQDRRDDVVTLWAGLHGLGALEALGRLQALSGHSGLGHLDQNLAKNLAHHMVELYLKGVAAS